MIGIEIGQLNFSPVFLLTRKETNAFIGYALTRPFSIDPDDRPSGSPLAPQINFRSDFPFSNPRLDAGLSWHSFEILERD